MPNRRTTRPSPYHRRNRGRAREEPPLGDAPPAAPRALTRVESVRCGRRGASSGDALSEVVFDEATCEWGIAPDCLTVRVPAGLVAKAGHVPPNGGTTSEEKASIPVSRRAHVLHASRPTIIRAATTRARRDVDVAPAKFFAASTDRNLHLLPTALIMSRRELH